MRMRCAQCGDHDTIADTVRVKPMTESERATSRIWFGPAVGTTYGTWRCDLLCQKWSDPRNAATQDVGR
eukprot:7259310-Prymnesium_polylepis.1